MATNTLKSKKKTKTFKKTKLTSHLKKRAPELPSHPLKRKPDKMPADSKASRAAALQKAAAQEAARAKLAELRGLLESKFREDLDLGYYKHGHETYTAYSNALRKGDDISEKLGKFLADVKNDSTGELTIPFSVQKIDNDDVYTVNGDAKIDRSLFLGCDASKVHIVSNGSDLKIDLNEKAVLNNALMGSYESYVTYNGKTVQVPTSKAIDALRTNKALMCINREIQALAKTGAAKDDIRELSQVRESLYGGFTKQVKTLHNFDVPAAQASEQEAYKRSLLFKNTHAPSLSKAVQLLRSADVRFHVKDKELSGKIFGLSKDNLVISVDIPGYEESKIYYHIDPMQLTSMVPVDDSLKVSVKDKLLRAYEGALVADSEEDHEHIYSLLTGALSLVEGNQRLLSRLVHVGKSVKGKSSSDKEEKQRYARFTEQEYLKLDSADKVAFLKDAVEHI